MDIPFYDWHYLGVYLPTPTTSTDIHSHVMDVVIPQSTLVVMRGVEPLRRMYKIRMLTVTSHDHFIAEEGGIEPHPT